MREVDVQLAVLGGGYAGYVAAIRGAQLGAAVALIEERENGGCNSAENDICQDV